VLALGCGSDTSGPDKSDDSEQEVEIFSWWVAPGEAGALNGIIKIFEDRNPGSRVVNAVNADAAHSRMILAQRLAKGDPPDLYQENWRQLHTFVHENPGTLIALDDFYDEHGLRKALVPELLDNVTVDGTVVAVPMGVHRANSLFYNKEIFAKYKITPPTNLTELLDVCKTLKEAGVTPFATSYEGWVQNLLFEFLHQTVLGTERYNAFLDGDPGTDNAKLADAVALYAQIVEQYTNETAGDEGFDWAEAANLLIDGKAAMYAHGDWAKGLYVQSGWVSDVDFAVVGPPGASDLFIYDLDIWVMPKGGPNPEGARGFLEAAVSSEGQLAFDLIKGATTVRSDLRSNDLDSIGKSVLESFRSARVRRPSPLPELSPVYEQFVMDHDQAKLVSAISKVYIEYQKGL
jgi:glucose/mannose transport system substrate-binding protein